MGKIQSKAISPGASLGTTVETVVATYDPVFAGRALQMGGIELHGVVVVSPGTGATGVTIRVRQGSVTGPLVDQAYVYSGMTAGLRYPCPFDVLDTSNAWDAVGGVTYVVTAQQTGSPTGGGTSPGGRIHAED